MNTNHEVIEMENSVGSHYYMIRMANGEFFQNHYGNEQIKTTDKVGLASHIANRKFAEELVTFLIRFFDESGAVRAEPLNEEEATEVSKTQSFSKEVHGRILTGEEVIAVWSAYNRNINKTYNHFGIKDGEELYKWFIKNIVWSLEKAERGPVGERLDYKNMNKKLNHIQKIMNSRGDRK